MKVIHNWMDIQLGISEMWALFEKKCSRDKKVLRNKKKWFRTTFSLFRHLDTPDHRKSKKVDSGGFRSDFLKIRGRSWMDAGCCPGTPGIQIPWVVDQPWVVARHFVQVSTSWHGRPPLPWGYPGYLVAKNPPKRGVSWVFGVFCHPQKGG